MDRDDPFDDLFRELDRLMHGPMGGTGMNTAEPAGTGTDAHVAVYEEAEIVRVVADLPGVPRDAIGLTCDGTRLTITAANRYEEQVRLPAPVDEHSASTTYNNGILEAVFDRA